jgi:hypothetical protein
MSGILGPDGVMTTSNLSTGVYKLDKQPIVDMRIVMFGKMMVHPQTKEMVMVPMQDVQYKRAGSEAWFSMPIEEVQNHEIKPEGDVKSV